MQEKTKAAICVALCADRDVGPVVRREKSDDVAKDIEHWMGNRYIMALLNHRRNQAYPDVQHPKLPTPSPDETETSESSKESTPDAADYGQTLEDAAMILKSDDATEDQKKQSVKAAMAELEKYLESF